MTNSSKNYPWKLQELPLERLRLAQELSALDQVIPRHEVKVGPETIVGVRPLRPRLAPPGSVVKGILECLRKAGGAPVTTIEVARYIARANDLTLASDQRADVVRCVGKRLCEMRAEGVIVSFHDTRPGSREWGRWALAADEDRKAA